MKTDPLKIITVNLAEDGDGAGDRAVTQREGAWEISSLFKQHESQRL